MLSFLTWPSKPGASSLASSEKSQKNANEAKRKLCVPGQERESVNVAGLKSVTTAWVARMSFILNGIRR
jgi:hypothetical protein